MRASTDRILTTHVGALPSPPDLASMVVDALDLDAFEPRSSRRMMDGLGFTRMTTSAARACGYGGGVGAWAAPTQDAFLLVMQDQGHRRVAQSGREVLLAAGDMAVLDASRPYVSEAQDPMGLVVINLPTERLL